MVVYLRDSRDFVDLWPRKEGMDGMHWLDLLDLLDLH